MGKYGEFAVRLAGNFAFILAGLVLAGCHETPVQTVDWYVAHKVQRQAMVDACRAMPMAKSMADENCAHADAAVRKADAEAPRWVKMK